MMNINKQDIDKIATAAENRWGAWAKYILGALIGALAAAGVITVTGCTASYTRDAAGSVSWQGVIVFPVNDSGK